MNSKLLDEVKLKMMEITGPVDVIKMRREDDWKQGFITIIMGPTGAGKSSFIEALAGSNLGLEKISSGGLDGFTQDVTAYKIQGISELVDPTRQIYLLDTPGFADDKISAFEIVVKVQTFFKETSIGSNGIPAILYFMPITITRLSGSQREVLNAFKALTGRQASGGITIVTTMWDTVWGEQAHRRAESNYEQLTRDVWKEFINKGTKMTKFTNTQVSALEVLDVASQRMREYEFNIEDAIQLGIEPAKTEFGRELYEDLVGRIRGLNLRREGIISNMTERDGDEDEDEDEDKEMRQLMEAEIGRVGRTLERFERQLVEFGTPPRRVLPLLTSSPVLVVQPDVREIMEPCPAAVLQERVGRMSRIVESTKRVVKKVARRDAR